MIKDIILTHIRHDIDRLRIEKDKALEAGNATLVQDLVVAGEYLEWASDYLQLCGTLPSDDRPEPNPAWE